MILLDFRLLLRHLCRMGHTFSVKCVADKTNIFICYVMDTLSNASTCSISSEPVLFVCSGWGEGATILYIFICKIITGGGGGVRPHSLSIWCHSPTTCSTMLFPLKQSNISAPISHMSA